MLTPKLNLDLTSGTLSPLVTFARPSAATRFNSSGILETVANDSPRFDYDPVTLAVRGLLIEEQRTNLFLRSQEFNDAAWTKDGASITANAINAPDGTLTGDKMIGNNGSTGSGVIRITTVTSSSTYTLTVFVQSDGIANWVQLINTSATGTSVARAWFNLSTGIVGTRNAGYSASSITSVGNGWYRVSATFTASGTSSQSIITNASDDNVNGYAGDGFSGIYIWGAQLEAGASATSYIPTTTAAVTRNADVATITSTAFSGIWRSGPGSLLVRALPSTVSGTRPLVQVDDATADNIIALRGNATNPELYIRAGGSDQATIDAGTISAAAYRLAGAWQAGSAAASLNSGLAINGAPASIPAVTQMRLGSDGTNYLNGHLQAVQYWPVRLSNASLQNASSTAGYQSIIHPVSRDTIITEPV